MIEPNGADKCKNTIDSLTSNAADIASGQVAAETPLHRAVKHGREDIVRLLLTRGADVNAVDPRTGCTPIFHAASAEIVDILLTWGANIDHRDNKGRTPLHTAAEDGRMSTVQSLIARGADVNVTDYEGWTPLHYAAHWHGNDIMIGVLLFYGADPNIMNRFGMTPCDLAGSRNHRPVVPVLSLFRGGC